MQYYIYIKRILKTNQIFEYWSQDSLMQYYTILWINVYDYNYWYICGAGCAAQYFEAQAASESNKNLMGYKCALNSKATEESLVYITFLDILITIYT